MAKSSVCKIYLLKNNSNGKIYIGQTWEEEVSDRMGKCGELYKNSPYIYNAIQKYGSESFKYTILAEANTQENADKIESEYIAEYNSQDPNIGYNLKDGGSHGKHSNETKEKISKSLSEKEWSQEALSARLSNLKSGKGEKRGPHTQEWKDNNSKMMIERHKAQGHPMQGKHHSEKAKQKISEALNSDDVKSKIYTEDRNKKISEALKHPKEQEILESYLSGTKVKDICLKFKTGNGTIYRILDRNGIDKSRPRDNWTGMKHSEETKVKMSESRKEYLESKK